MGYVFHMLAPVGSDWLTDHRRARAAVRDQRKAFDDLRQLAPELVEDLRQTMEKEPLYRDILIVPNSDSYIDRSTPAFIYYDIKYPKVKQQALAGDPKKLFTLASRSLWSDTPIFNVPPSGERSRRLISVT